MNTTTTDSPWSTASAACWAQVSVATELAKITTMLSHLPVGSVIPIHSSIAPTLIVTPLDPSDIDAIKDLTVEIAAQFAERPKWTTFVQGDNWLARLKLASGVRIDISTSITASQPTKFEV